MLSKLKKFSRPTIGLICVFGIVLVWQILPLLPLLPPILWPGGIGIEKDDSVTTTTVETIEKDKQGKTVKKVTTTAHNDGKTLWDWGSLLGVPLSLAILGYFLQQQQQKRTEKLSKEQQKIADNETKEEVLQTYFDRLSVLLIDRNLIVLSNKSNSSTITPEEQELLDSSLDVIRARTLSILRRFENDKKRKASVINFLIETEIIGKSKLNLQGADLSGADLTLAKLQGANLRGSELLLAKLQGAELLLAKLQGADLRVANLQGAKLQGAKLQGANLQGADLRVANLQEADLSGADLQVANLQEADLSGADLQVAKLQGADLFSANLQGAKLQGAELLLAKLQGAKLQGAKLQGAELLLAKLQGANLKRAELQRANLSEAKLQGANLSEAKLQGANLIAIKWDSETVWPDKSAFTDAINIPKKLKKELGITP